MSEREEHITTEEDKTQKHEKHQHLKQPLKLLLPAFLVVGSVGAGAGPEYVIPREVEGKEGWKEADSHHEAAIVSVRPGLAKVLVRHGALPLACRPLGHFLLLPDESNAFSLTWGHRSCPWCRWG